MYKILFLIPLLISCSHQKPRSKEFVTLKTALVQARSSYLLGCTEARVELKVKDAFNHCTSKAQKHLSDLEGIMDQELE